MAATKDQFWPGCPLFSPFQLNWIHFASISKSGGGGGGMTGTSGMNIGWGGGEGSLDDG